MGSQTLAELEQRIDRGEIAGVTADSRRVGPGVVFVAVRGARHDGHDFIVEAQKRGAAAIVVERSGEGPVTAPLIRVRRSAEVLGVLAARLAGDPTYGMSVVGVTGTSGKTTTSFLIESIFKAAGRKPGVVGTIAHRFLEQVVPADATTPDSVFLQSLFKEMAGRGCDSVVMEVSSHALKQSRVAGTLFDVALFTNLTPEHLDYHPDMEDYFAAKLLLFTHYLKVSAARGKHPRACIGLSPWGEKLVSHLRALPDGIPCMTFGLNQRADVNGSGIHIGFEGISGEVRFPSGERVQIRSPLLGAFNAENILGAIAAAHSLQIAPSAIRAGIEGVKTVPGRLERVNNNCGIEVLVDYAHKPDALEKVLLMLKTMIRDRKQGSLITVFGCGGDRDRSKRPKMGEIASRLSDYVIVTSDNPRTEDPASIISQITEGIGERQNWVSTLDRSQAIEAAIQRARPGDVVLIAGKGHEDYQILGTKKVPFDDREVARKALSGLTR